MSNSYKAIVRTATGEKMTFVIDDAENCHEVTKLVREEVPDAVAILVEMK